MHALQFYSPLVTDQIKGRRKTVTIRLGDKSRKYEKGMIVAVLVGQRFGPRERVVSSTNRNFESRQGPETRTHLASPETVAASAIAGRIADVRELLATAPAAQGA